MENSNGESQSFFETPVTPPERSHYDRFTRRDEKIADINASLASKTRIIPEQQRLIMENALTKHWVPLSDKDSRRFGPPTPETERQFEKAVAAEVTRERELLRKQGFSEDQIAGKMSEREQQARVRLARDKKEFFTIRDKPYEAPKPKTNQELLVEARAAYDEAEKQFKTKLNSLLDDANEKTNGQARAAKIQLEKARKNLIHAFTGEDDPELVKKYTELLQRSATRDEAEAKIFRYKQENPRQEARDPRSFFTPDVPIERPKRPQPRVFTPQEEESMRTLFEEKTDEDDVIVGPDGMGTPVHKSPFARETNSTVPKPEVGTIEDSEDETKEPRERHSYEYFVVQGKKERDALKSSLERYVATINGKSDDETKSKAYDQVMLHLDSIRQFDNFDIYDPKDAEKFEDLKKHYYRLVDELDYAIQDGDRDSHIFLRNFEFNESNIVKNVDASLDPQFTSYLENDPVLDALDDSGRKLRLLTEEMPAPILTDETIDQFIQAHVIDPSGLVKAFEDYKKDPSEQNKDALMLSIGEIKEQHEELDNLLKQTRFRKSQELTGPFKQGIDYSKGSEKYEGFKDFNQDIKTLITYSLETTGFEKSTARPDLYGNDLYRDEVFIDMYVDWMRAKGVAPE
ncbi:hypothetical protein KBD68_04850, partial [Candidatus Woesebacteria bacterium]|nr:hypothetical protein [Candidatus Woesebacteria bacterium]